MRLALALVLVAACGCLGCGARTGLELDPPRPRDSGPDDLDAGRPTDGGPDARRPDAAFVDPSGVWVGPIRFGPTERVFTYVLLARPKGSVMGYLAGSPPTRRVLRGNASGDEISLVLEMVDSRLTRTIEVRGRVEGDRVVGTTNDGDGPQPFEWRREDVFEERRWVMWERPDELHDVAAAFRGGSDEATGEFVSGGFVNRVGCEPIACGGALLDLHEELGPGGWTLDIEVGGPGATTGTLHATAPDVAPLHYVGTYDLVAADGTVRTGTIEVVRAGSARIESLEGMMASLATIGDAQEDGPPLPVLPISATYRHEGLDRSRVIAVLTAEAASARTVDVGSLRLCVDALSPLDDPAHTAPIGLAHRRILSDAGGTVLFDVDTDMEGLLRYFAEESGIWVVSGNGR